MRSFALINEKGMRWDLNDLNSYFHDVNGLGQEYKTAYEQVGNMFIKTDDEMKQKNITGKIRFADYKKYEEFALFIQHKPIILEYVATDKYFIKVSIDKLTKKELETMGLICDIAIKSLGTFYKPVFYENTEILGGKRYPYTYEHTYTDIATGAIQIESNSVLESPVRITIIGPCKNPSWKHYLNGSVKATGKINCEIKAGNRLIVSTEKVPWEIAEYTNNEEFVCNRYEDSDFTTKRFVNLGFGTNKIVFSHEAEGDLKLVMEGRVEYETV